MLTCWWFENMNLATLHTTSHQELICSVSITSYESIRHKNEKRSCTYGQLDPIANLMSKMAVQSLWFMSNIPSIQPGGLLANDLSFWCYTLKQHWSVDKKNQLDVTFCILYFSSNSCSTCFGHPCAHHQELMTAWCYSLVLVCAVAAGRLSSPVGR